MRLAGYAALFDIADGAGDVIRKGAFAAAVARARQAGLPLFWQHRAEQRIGAVSHLAEDDRGLQVIARIDNPQGRAGTALAARAVSGLSFGYRARRYRPLGKGRLLEEIDLLEVSLVSHPLQHGARVHMLA